MNQVTRILIAVGDGERKRRVAVHDRRYEEEWQL
jgi:hypothetical protein